MPSPLDVSPPGGAFVHVFSVSPEDIDELGHAGNVRWVQWLSDAAAAHSRSIGLDLASYREMGVLWVVRKHEIEYLGEAKEGERLEAVTWVDSLRGATSLRRTIFRRGSQVLARAATTWVLVSMTTGRPTRIPKDLLARYGYDRRGPAKTP